MSERGIDMGATQLLFVRLSGLIRKLLIKRLVAEYSKVAIDTILSYLLLIFPPPSFITKLLVNYKSMLAIFFWVAFLALFMGKNGSGWETIQAVCIFSVFATTLINQWQMPPTTGEMSGGLIPWADAADYNLEAPGLATVPVIPSMENR